MVVRSATDHREVPPMLDTPDLSKLTFAQLSDLHHHLADAHHAMHLAWRAYMQATGSTHSIYDDRSTTLYHDLDRVHTALRAHPDHPLNTQAKAMIEIGTEGVMVRRGFPVISANGNPGYIVGLATADGHFVNVRLRGGRVVMCAATQVTVDVTHDYGRPLG